MPLRPRGAPQAPARGPDLLGPVVCNVAGIVLVVVAWVATSGQPANAAQIPYVNLGIGGVILAGAGDLVLLVGTRRLLRQRIWRLTASLQRAREASRR